MKSAPPVFHILRITAVLFLTLTAGCEGGAATRPPASSHAEAPPSATVPASDRDFRIRLWANQICQDSANPELRQNLVAAGAEAIPILLDLLSDAGPSEQERLLSLLVEIKDRRSIPVLIDMLGPGADPIHQALRSIAGIDPGPRKSDWQAWWNTSTGAPSAAECEQIRRAFLSESPTSQNEILRALVWSLSTTTFIVHRDPIDSKKKPERPPRALAGNDPEETRRRLAAVPILEAVLDQGEAANLIYVEPLARQIGPESAPALRQGLSSPHDAVRQVCAQALSTLTPPSKDAKPR